MSEKFNWTDINTEKFYAKYDLLETSFGIPEREPFYFKVTEYYCDVASISFYQNKSSLEFGHPTLGNKTYGNPLSYNEFGGDSNTAKKIVENTIEHFNQQQNLSVNDIEDYLRTQCEQANYEYEPPTQQDTKREKYNLLLHPIPTLEYSHFFIFEYQKDGENFVDYEQFNAGETIDRQSLQAKYGSSYKMSGPFFEPSDVHYRILNIEDEIKQNLFKKNTEQVQNQQEQTQPTQAADRQLETAQKTGYVQGVCESVLAFNNDDNRKIMTDSTMAFLSKKLLSEMNVTKDMAKKFANPETYKALEHCVFVPEQAKEQEQTRSRGCGL